MKKYITVIASIVFVLSVITWFKPADEFSQAERRKLKQFPKLSVETIMNGSFMANFEEAALDQFPFREKFRALKAIVNTHVFQQKDNNGLYLVENHISEMDPELSEKALQKAVKKFTSVYNTYLADTQTEVYYAIIPDKNYFLAEQNGYLAYDYEDLYAYMEKNLSGMKQIEIKELLEVDDYYYTDSHWKQEKIVGVAQHLLEEMGAGASASYEEKRVESPFYGVYYGQLGLPVEADELKYLNNENLTACIVRDEEKGKEISMYNMKLASGRDPYEMFLGGSLPVVSVENPSVDTDKELVIFRDSFGSSIAPLLAESYKKITLLDIRYMNEKMIEKFVDFSEQDVLFLYSSSVLNNETAF